MDKKNVYLFVLLFTASVAVIVLTFFRVFVSGNYYIVKTVSCDPSTEECIENDCGDDIDCMPFYKEIIIFLNKNAP